MHLESNMTVPVVKKIHHMAEVLCKTGSTDADTAQTPYMTCQYKQQNGCCTLKPRAGLTMVEIAPIPFVTTRCCIEIAVM